MAAPVERGVDGRRFLRRAVGFGRALHRAGLRIDVGAAVDFARSLEIVEVGDREEVRAAGATVFVRRKDDLARYDEVFDRYWRARAWPSDAEPSDETRMEPTEPGEGEPTVPPLAGDERISRSADDAGQPVPGDDDEAIEATEANETAMSPDAYSRLEALRHRDFDRMTPEELRDAERLVDLLEPRLERRRTRRYELHPHGRRLAPRAMFRRNLGTGGEILEWVWRRPILRPRPLVVICDISGSMERHSRLLLRFVQALSASSAVRTESFVFGSRDCCATGTATAR
jgi:uncharacterized protein with von Willebrand factor type A (vWA) domain